jgi:hypothetical protein
MTAVSWWRPAARARSRATRDDPNGGPHSLPIGGERRQDRGLTRLFHAEFKADLLATFGWRGPARTGRATAKWRR